eukprot:Lithocolla_globosa_v1_NODE_762_length_3323_cov_18.216340.p5 type:complete len:123 gc:universal NODE_762_length_3323_cov_18.216340:2056-1688(-)
MHLFGRKHNLACLPMLTLGILEYPKQQWRKTVLSSFEGCRDLDFFFFFLVDSCFCLSLDLFSGVDKEGKVTCRTKGRLLESRVAQRLRVRICFSPAKTSFPSCSKSFLKIKPQPLVVVAREE